jgi:predicted nucleic acid-binding protein
MPRLVCLDTQMLIWGIQEHATSGQEDLIDRAKALLKQLVQEKNQFIIPSIVLSEFLIRMPGDVQQTLNDLAHHQFQIVPFDVSAAMHFSRIWQANVDPVVKTGVYDGTKTSRHELKADILIIATAVARKATCIYSCDRNHMKRFAQGVIEIQDLRTMNLYGPLFDNGPDTPL